jgi:hypothetical protein
VSSQLVAPPDVTFYLVGSEEQRDRIHAAFEEAAMIRSQEAVMDQPGRVLVLLAGSLDEEVDAMRTINETIAAPVPGGPEPVFKVLDQRGK